MNPADVRTAYAGGRLTPQRRAIAEAAGAMPGAFTVESLSGAVRRRDASIGVATVYRAVSAMVASGWLERIGDRDGHALFVHCQAAPGHHHHVVCDGCGRVEIAACPLPELPDATADGFTVRRHEVTYYGVCPACASREKRTA